MLNRAHTSLFVFLLVAFMSSSSVSAEMVSETATDASEIVLSEAALADSDGVSDDNEFAESSESNEIDITADAYEDNSSDLILYGGLTAAATEEGIQRVRTGWTKTDGGRQYILSDGSPAIGMLEIDGIWYLFDENGFAASGWTDFEGDRVYALNGGVLASGIVEIGDANYLLDDFGHPLNGWQSVDGDLYYAESDGRIRTGWFEEFGKKYLAMEDGRILHGWIMHDDRTYYQSDSGVAVGLSYVDGERRIFDADGGLSSGDAYLDGIHYLTDSDGYPLVGWVDRDGARYYTDANGAVLTGWQVIDGDTYHFEDDGRMTTGFMSDDNHLLAFDDTGKLIIGEASAPMENVLSLMYNGFLYEGEIPSPENINVEYVGFVFGPVDKNLNVTPEGPEWEEPAYGTVTLRVKTNLGTGSIDVPVIPVDHIEAEYDGYLYAGDVPLVQNLSVWAVYEDGERRSIHDYTCKMPDGIDEDAVIEIYSDYGNTSIPVPLAKADTTYAYYEGSVREGEMLDSEKLSVWTVMEDGQKRYTDDFTAEKVRVFNDTSVRVTVGDLSSTCRVKCSPIKKITVAGKIYEDDSLAERNLIVRYEDGSIGTWYPNDYDWVDPSSAKLGESFRTIEFLGRRYVAYLDVQRKAQTSAVGGDWLVSGAQSIAPYTSRTSLGIWTLTAYADTPEDQGPYVGKTASGAALVEGRTVAVSAATMARLGLRFGDRLEINGHVYTIEDHGGSAMDNQNWVDIFVADPAREYDAAYNTPSEVFLLR